MVVAAVVFWCCVVPKILVFRVPSCLVLSCLVLSYLVLSCCVMFSFVYRLSLSFLFFCFLFLVFSFSFVFSTPFFVSSLFVFIFFVVFLFMLFVCLRFLRVPSFPRSQTLTSTLPHRPRCLRALATEPNNQHTESWRSRLTAEMDRWLGVLVRHQADKVGGVAQAFHC